MKADLTEKKKKRKSKGRLSTIILVLVFFLGISILLYPSISDYVNSKTQSRAIADYEATVAGMKTEDYSEMFAAAENYNESLKVVFNPLIEHQQLTDYLDLLNIGGRGIMGYIDIERIKVELPIYHGTADEILNIAVGHLEGTSLPIGGEGTHSVLTAHRGLPSSKLFTNLDKLEERDVFTITILNQLFTYEVDQIRIVEPHEVDLIEPKAGEDHCTLVTCTPYGINTHRLLVRGTRIENAASKPVIFVTADAYMIDSLVVMPIVATPMLLILLIVLLVKYRRKKE